MLNGNKRVALATALVLGTSMAPLADEPNFTPDLTQRTAGIDMSHFQGKSINWVKVKSDGIAFVMAKASQGMHTVDADFIDHVTGANSQGIPVGAYHFFQPGEAVVAQVDHFLSRIAGQSLQLPPALDLEGNLTKADFKAAVEWIDRVHDRTGCRPLLYIDQSHYMAMADLLTPDQPIWLAAYTRTLPTSHLPRALYFWQHSDIQSISGIIGHTDTDWFFGSVRDLSVIACPPPAPAESRD